MDSEMTHQIKVVELKAMGKARPRVTRHGTFMPRSYEKWRYDFRRLFGPVEVSGLIRLEIESYRKLPKRTSNQPGDYCTAGPDSDNTAGAVMDALFDDDSSVVDQRCIKMWGDKDSLVVRLYEVG